MKLLDLFCCAGGAAMGYYQAGFTEIVGVDIKPQSRYPFTFVQGDALEYLVEHGQEFDVIHASPPCQAYTDLKTLHSKTYPDLISATRDLLRVTEKPYVIENVEGAPLINPIMLCGVMFGLKVFRHRLFETNPWLLAPGHPKHNGSTGTHRWPYTPVNGYIQVTGTGGNFTLEQAQKAMGIDWMNKEEISQAIPPAYTKWIGEQLLTIIKEHNIMATITAKGPNKTPKTLRGVSEDEVEMKCALLEDAGYTRISVETAAIPAKQRRQAERQQMTRKYQQAA